MTFHLILKLGFAGVAFSIALGGPTSPARAESDLYQGFTLLDPGAETRTPNAYILVENGRIAAVGAGAAPSAPPPDHVYDMTGRFALPGFIDAHAHITTGMQKIEMRDGAPVLTLESDDAITRHAGRIALAYGVTTIRDPGGDPEANARYDAKVASGEWLGPEALHAGAVIEPPPMDGHAFAYPRTEAEWQAEAQRQAGLGMRYFKLYQDLTEDELASGIRVAHEHGLKAIAHLNAVSWTRAAELGIDGLEHALPTSPDLLEPDARAVYLSHSAPDATFMYRWFELADYDGPLIQHMIALLAQKRIATDMTLVVNELVYNTDRLDEVFPPAAQAEELPEAYANWRATITASAYGWTPEDYERARAVMPKVLEFARRLHDAGVPMMIGTDCRGGTYFYPRELQLHVDAGIPVWEVLRMATSKTADVLGIGDRTGRIAPGYEADVTFFDADPSTDIGAAADVYAVLDDGEFLLSDALKQSSP